MRRTWLIGLCAIAALASAACKGEDEARTSGGVDPGALAQLQVAAGGDPALVLTLRPAGWPAVQSALAHIPTTQLPWLAPVIEGDDARPLLARLVGEKAAAPFASDKVRITCGLGSTRDPDTTREARLVAAVAAGQPAAPTLGEARGRCVLGGVTLDDVGALSAHLGLTPVPTKVAGARAWQDDGGLFVAARADAHAVIAAGALRPVRRPGAPEEVDDAVRELLKGGSAPAETPGLRALALPGSLGGVLIRAEAARRLGSWLGLRELIAALEGVPEADQLHLTARGVAIAAAVDHVVPGLLPDIEDAALVVGGADERLIVTVVESLTEHGAAVVDAAFGASAPTHGVTAPSGVKIAVRFNAKAASAALSAEAAGEPPSASAQAATRAGIWGYVGRAAHAWSLWALDGDELVADMGAAPEGFALEPGDIARWAADLSEARSFLDVGVASPARLGVKRFDGLVRRSGRAVVLRWVASFAQAEAPALTTPSFEGLTWEASAPSDADRCLLRANEAFADLLERYSAEDASTADLAALVLRIAASKPCLGGSLVHERRLEEMLWATKMLVADTARGRWDRATVAASLAGACDQELIPAACAMMRANAAGPTVRLVERTAGCDKAPTGPLVRVVPGEDGPEIWVADEKVANPAGAAAALKQDPKRRHAQAIVLADPRLTMADLAPLFDALTRAEVTVLAAARSGGRPVVTRIQWELDAAPDHDVVVVAPTTPWRTVLRSMDERCSLRMALGAGGTP